MVVLWLVGSLAGSQLSCLSSSIFFEPTTATAQILFVLGVLHFWKTTWTRLVWRTWPCGNEEYAAFDIKTFQSLTTSIPVWVRNQQLLSYLLWIKYQLFKKFFTFRGGPLDKDEQLSLEAPVIIFNIKVLHVLSESIPYSLCLGFGTFTHAQTPTWSLRWWSYML